MSMKSKLLEYLENTGIKISAFQRTVKPYVSYQTIYAVAKQEGFKLQSYEKAKAISEATGGVVTVQDLCE